MGEWLGLGKCSEQYEGLFQTPQTVLCAHEIKLHPYGSEGCHGTKAY